MTGQEQLICRKCGIGIVMPILDYDGNVTHRCTLCGWSRTEVKDKTPPEEKKA